MIESTRRHRRSIRLPEYDYTTPGAYFVTICTYDKACTFADRHLARIVEKVWCWATKASPEEAGIDYVVMPNHVHGIVWIRELHAVGTQHPADSLPFAQTLLSDRNATSNVDAGAAPLRPAGAPALQVQKGSLAASVRTFKSVARQRKWAWLEATVTDR